MQQDADDGTATQEEKRKTKDETYGCGEGRHEGGGHNRGSCRGEEMDITDLLWRCKTRILYIAEISIILLKVFSRIGQERDISNFMYSSYEAASWQNKTEREAY